MVTNVRLPAILCLAGVIAVFACGEINATNNPCEKGTECLAPYVCCTTPRIPKDGQKVPFCEDPNYCDAWLPFLIEGNPCERLPLPKEADPTGPSAVDCAEGLECCKATLVCAKAGSCPTDEADASAPLAPDAAPPTRTCNADVDCIATEVCCEISFFDREGTCRTVAGCRALTGR